MVELNPKNSRLGNLLQRRTFFEWLTYLLSTVAAVVLGFPLIGYFLGVQREARWVTLDEVDRFPVNETRLRSFDNPLRQPWDGMTALTGVYVRNLGLDEQGNRSFWSSPCNCPIWAARFPGSHSPACSCARVMAASTTPTATVPQAPRPAAFSAVPGGYAMANWRSRHPIIRPCKTPLVKDKT